jgi:hypothetical protein
MRLHQAQQAAQVKSRKSFPVIPKAGQKDWKP